MKVNERSSKTVISTGVMRPFSCAVCALNALQNSMMFTPCWPSAGPTGGAGFACPPGICSLINVRTFLAISVQLLDLVERELHGNLALEDVDEHVARQHAFLRLDLLAFLRLDHLLGRDDDAAEAGCLVHGHDPVLEIGLHLVLVPGVGVDHIPAEHGYFTKTCSTRRLNTRSEPYRKTPTIRQAISTTTTPWISWFWPGHSTFFSSPHDSETKRLAPPPGRARDSRRGSRRGDGSGVARAVGRRGGAGGPP